MAGMDLLPISEVAAGFGLPISTLHYWERCGLVTPHRRSGRRCYDRDQLYRIALLRVWRETGRLSVDDIAAALGVRATGRGWRDTVSARIEAIDAEAVRLETARSYLTHLLECRHDGVPDECPQFREEVKLPAVSGSMP